MVKKVKKKKPSYIINIAEFYFLESAEMTKIRFEKEANLEKAMAAGEKLPLAPLDMKYWPEYLKSQ